MNFAAMQRGLDLWARDLASVATPRLARRLGAALRRAFGIDGPAASLIRKARRAASVLAPAGVRLGGSAKNSAVASARRISSYRAMRRKTPINLALQGGGAHGAFTWGVIDDLLAAEQTRFPAISGSSAGAMNAAVMVSGLMDGGCEAARERLRAYWRDVSALSPIAGGPPEILAGSLARSIESVGRLVSPYQTNPFNLNPLRTIVDRHVDFDALRSPHAPRLFVAATDIETAAPRIFTNEELSADALLASACLPQLQQAVEIDGHWYWDGGYSSNPPLLPLVDSGTSADTLIVQILPSRADDPPKDSREISARHAMMAFSGPLRRELAEIERAKELARSGVTLGGASKSRAARHRLHRIEAPDLSRKFGRGSALTPDWGNLCEMRDLGARETQEWRELYLPLVGREQTLRMAA